MSAGLGRDQATALVRMDKGGGLRLIRRPASAQVERLKKILQAYQRKACVKSTLKSCGHTSESEYVERDFRGCQLTSENVDLNSAIDGEPPQGKLGGHFTGSDSPCALNLSRPGF